MHEALKRLQNSQNGNRQILLAEYASALSALHKSVMATARDQNPSDSILARLGLGDLAWMRHLNSNYKGIHASLPALNALSPELPPKMLKQRPAWPQGFDPKTEKRATLLNLFTWGYLAVAVKNELWIPKAQPEEVFSSIQNAAHWGRYYVNVGKVSIKKLDRLGQEFTFRTFDTTFKSKIVIYQEAGEVLSIGWHAKGPLATIIVHRWDIYSDGMGGSIVTTEESQYGIKPVLTAPMITRAMEVTHQNWLYGHAVAALDKNTPPKHETLD